MRFSGFIATAFALATLSQAASASNNDLADLAERAKPSVVLLTVEDTTGRKIGTGTGFFVSADGRIVTNHHVITEASRVTATLADGSRRAVLGLLVEDAEKDIAILKAEGEGTPALSLGDSRGVKPGDEVVVIGSPRGLSGTLSIGIVSAIREHGIDDQDLPGAEKPRSWGIQITAPISPGSSGSPVMTRDGEVIAVAVGTYNDAQSLNFGVPIEVTRGLLDRIGPKAPVRPFEGNSQESVLKNLLISAAAIGGPVLLYVLWSRLSARRERPKSRARSRS